MNTNTATEYRNLFLAVLTEQKFGAGWWRASGGDKWTTTPDGAALRTLLDVNLAEVSITSFAAYPATSVSIRSAPPEIRSLITRSNENGGDSDCFACSEDDDCENCSMEDCEDEVCAENGCPAQEDDDERSKSLS